MSVCILSYWLHPKCLFKMLISDCGHTAIPNGALDFFEGNKYSAKAKLNCDVGFRVHGTGFIQCMETGHWSNDSICLMIGKQL